jgi:dTDP-4-dehydrorhamnose reductase
MLGQEVEALLVARGRAHVASGSEVDIRSSATVERYAHDHRPAWIVNCAAYTAVDRAETEEALAMAVNAAGPRYLAEAADHVGARLLHVSTDYVFAGESPGPYGEDAPLAPLGAYGRSKAAGEAAVRALGPQHVIVRTSWLHGPGGPNFVATMLRLLSEREDLRVVDDQRGRPTYATDLADVLLALTQAGLQVEGTFHYANQGACTWHAFACEIQDQALESGLLRRRIPIHPIPTAAYPTPARRPANSVLATERIEDALGLPIPRWQDGLTRHLDRLRPGRDPA